MKIIQNNNTDNKGNYYWNNYFKADSGSKAIACFGGTNHEFIGTPKIVLRKGDGSKFGNEILLQFLIAGKVQEYDADSEHQVLEFYFNSKEGLHFLKEAIKYIENEVENES